MTFSSPGEHGGSCLFAPVLSMKKTYYVVSLSRWLVHDPCRFLRKPMRPNDHASVGGDSVGLAWAGEDAGKMLNVERTGIDLAASVFHESVSREGLIQ
jgi:hypothetical protein